MPSSASLHSSGNVTTSDTRLLSTQFGVSIALLRLLLGGVVEGTGRVRLEVGEVLLALLLGVRIGLGAAVGVGDGAGLGVG